jgi:uncharacterized protein (TIGR03790 family)
MKQAAGYDTANRWKRRRAALAILLLAMLPWLPPTPGCLALQADNLLVVYNKNLQASKELAAYYGERREVPADNLIGLPLPDGEFISRPDFERQLAAPLRQKLATEEMRGKIHGMVLIYGVPLKVGPETVLPAGWLDSLSAQKSALAGQMNALLSRLEKILELPAEKAPAYPSEEDLQKRWQRVEGQLSGWQQQHGLDQDFTARSAEVQTMIVRLNGLAPIARNLLPKRGKNIDPASLDRVIFVSSLFDQQLGLFSFEGITGDNLFSALSLQQVNYGLLGAYALLNGQQQLSPIEESAASVDSELSLLLRGPFRVGRWLANPLSTQFDGFPGIEHLRRDTLMVCRLDGPSPAIVRRMIGDSLAAEKEGLSGNFYIDARGLGTGDQEKDFYAEYDRRLKALYEQIKDNSPLPVVFDDKAELFAADSRLPAALYVGWYSLAEYVDAFAWQRGAIGFHVASAEARTLHDANSNVWCKRMLEKGVAATLGPVEEPYLQSFPPPDQFFPLLLKGELSLLEVYYRTLPSLSWRQVLIGDPLYRPFRKIKN